MPYAYILRCSDGSLYIGHTDDPNARENADNRGSAAAYTARRRPVRIVHVEEHASADQAVARERQLKGWTTAKKEALIVGNVQKLKSLAKRRT